MTPTDMGSGSFASAGFGSAAFMRQIGYFLLVDGGGATRYNSPIVTVTNANCYSHVGNYASVDPFWQSSFFFGGPGKNASCP